MTQQFYVSNLDGNFLETPFEHIPIHIKDIVKNYEREQIEVYTHGRKQTMPGNLNTDVKATFVSINPEDEKTLRLLMAYYDHNSASLEIQYKTTRFHKGIITEIEHLENGESIFTIVFNYFTEVKEEKPKAIYI